jgi:hypothetical protein
MRKLTIEILECEIAFRNSKISKRHSDRCGYKIVKRTGIPTLGSVEDPFICGICGQKYKYEVGKFLKLSE